MNWELGKVNIMPLILQIHADFEYDLQINDLQYRIQVSELSTCGDLFLFHEVKWLLYVN